MRSLQTKIASNIFRIKQKSYDDMIDMNGRKGTRNSTPRSLLSCLQLGTKVWRKSTSIALKQEQVIYFKYKK